MFHTNSDYAVQVRDGLRAAVESCGVVIRTDAEVASIDSDGGRVTGVSLISGESLGADVVVANRDVPGAYQLLKTDYGREKQWSLSAKRFSAGVISYNWVVRDAGFPVLLHHNVFISGGLYIAATCREYCVMNQGL